MVGAMTCEVVPNKFMRILRKSARHGADPFAISLGNSWPSVALAFAVVAIETGYLMAYRQGWQLNRASLFSNVTVAVLLIPVGMIPFQEQIS